MTAGLATPVSSRRSRAAWPSWSSKGVTSRPRCGASPCNRLPFSLSERQWPRLLELIAPELTARSDCGLLAAVRAFTGSLDQLRADSAASEFPTLLPPCGSIPRSPKAPSTPLIGQHEPGSVVDRDEHDPAGRNGGHPATALDSRRCSPWSARSGSAPPTR
jgi:hypothetical protein